MRPRRKLLMLGFLGLLVLAAGWLRLHDLASRSLWADELFTLDIAAYRPLLPGDHAPAFRRTDILHLQPEDTFWTTKAAEQSPPLQEVLEKIAVQWLGPHEWAARLPGALASTALLLFAALQCWRARGTPAARPLAWLALLVALHPALVMYAGEARAYSLGTSLLMAATILSFRRWHAGFGGWTPTTWSEVGLLVLACHTHYLAAGMAALLIGSDWLVALLTRRHWIRAMTVRVLVLATAMLPWLALNAHTIVFTAQGGVAWSSGAAASNLPTILGDVAAVWHGPWLVVALLATLTFGIQSRLIPGHTTLLKNPDPHAPLWDAQWLFVGLTVLEIGYLLGAVLITRRAGMAHPRFYLFGLPPVLLGMAVLLARARTWLPTLVLVVAVATLATPSSRLTATFNVDDFRSMSREAARGTDRDTVFVYQWIPNRPMYRVYLQNFLGYDPGERLVGISEPSQAATLCQRLHPARHVVLLSHAWGRPVMDALAAQCGLAWPDRTVQNFHNTFTEHWRAEVLAARNAQS